eukprot:4201368-Heterocapsa_arctica.AAC.1
MGGLIRTLVRTVESKYDVTIPKNGNLIPWMVRHAGWLCNRFHRWISGKTAFFAANGVDFRNNICVFGEVVYGKLQDKELTKDKLEARWAPGVYLGIVCESDER